MIEARIYLNDSELGRVRIVNVGLNEDGTADYSVQFGVERAGAVGMHRRALKGFPRLRYNVLALLLQALNTLDASELELEKDANLSDPVPLDLRSIDWR